MPGRRRALLVAVDTYEDERLPDLTAPVGDAHALAEVLGDESLGGFEVETLCDKTHWAVTERVEDVLADSRPEDLVLLHFGCHGLKNDAGGLYLAASNTRPQRLVSTGIDSTAITRMMRESPAGSVILLLDCCFGGAFARGMLARAADDLDLGTRMDGSLSGGRGLAVLTASSAVEWAFEKDGATSRGAPGASVFTRALVEGIRSGEADRNEDGLVSLHELYDYVRERVRAESPRQTPRKWEFDVHGDLYVARSPRRRVVASELPGEVTRLLSHHDVRIRVIGIEDLAGLATGADLAVAVTARRMLMDLVKDDSRRVSVAAEEALARTRLRLAPTSVDLGLVRLGSRAEPAFVDVGGAPLARMSLVRADGGVRAWIDGDHLVITAVPAAPGLVSGTVTLTGPAGEASVRVTGWAMPDPLPLLDEALQLAGTVIGDPFGEVLARLSIAFVSAQAGDRDRMLGSVARVPDLLRTIAAGSDRAIAAVAYVWMGSRAGDASRTGSWVTWARASLPPPSPDSTDLKPVLAGLLVDWAAVLTGERDRVDAILTRVSGLLEAKVTDTEALGACLAGVAWAAASAGYVEQARSLLDVAESKVKPPGEGPGMLVVLWVRVQLSDRDHALRLIGLGEEVVAEATGEMPIDGFWLAILGWAAAWVGDPDRGRALLDRALDVGGRTDAETAFKDRVSVCLATAWLAAHSGFPDLALTGARVADEPAPSDWSPDDRALTLVTAALVADMAGDSGLHGRWLQEAAGAVEAISERADSALHRFFLEWVQALPRRGTGSRVVAAAVDMMAESETEGDGEDALVDIAAATVFAWVGVASGANEEAKRVLAEIEAELESGILGDACLEAYLSAFAAWVAAQADDRERALRLMEKITATVRDGHGSQVERSFLLLALAWVSLAGGHRQFRPLIDLVDVLVPNEPRTDRTVTVLNTWTALCRQILPST